MEEDRESKLLGFAVRLGVNFAALWLAAEWVRGFDITGWESILATAFIFALVNAFIKPVADLVGLPVTCLTLGLFHLIINTAMLALTVWIVAEVSARRNWVALIAIPATFGIGVSCGLPLYLYLRTRPVVD